MIKMKAFPRHTVNLSREIFRMGIRSLLGREIFEGKDIEKFEEEFAKCHEVKYTRGVFSARAGLYLILKAFCLQKNDEIILSAFNYCEIPALIKSCGLVPVFVDVYPETFNINPSEIERCITPKTRALLITHTFGQPCEMDTIMRIAEKRKLRVIEDCAHACGAEYEGQKVGTFGDAAIFSFAMGKNIPCFGGGAAITKNERLWKEMNAVFGEYFYPSLGDFLKLFIAHFIGYLTTHPKTFPYMTYPILRILDMFYISLSSYNEKAKGERGKIRTDYQKRMMNVQARIGLHQLKRLDSVNAVLRKNGLLYNTLLEGKEGILAQKEMPNTRGIYLYYCLTAENREILRKKMLRMGIDTEKNRLSNCPALEKRGEAGETYAVSKMLAEKSFDLPNSIYLTPADIERITDNISKAIYAKKQTEIPAEAPIKMPKKILLVRAGSDTLRNMSHPKHCHPPYTLKYVESMLRSPNEYEVRLIDCIADVMDIKNLLSETFAWFPEIIVIETNFFSIQNALAYASRVKEKKDVFIIATGEITMPSLKGEIAHHRSFDVILPGEAEREISALIERISQVGDKREEEIERYASYRTEEKEPFLEENPDSLPFPRYTQAELRKYHFLYPLKTSKRLVWGHVLSSRGCPENCVFCSPTTRVSFGKRFRTRSAENVVDEMRYLVDEGVNTISFDDDNFTASKAHVENVCREIRRKKIKVKWIAHGRIDNITPGLMKEMKKAGCVLLRFGIESGSRRIIELLGKSGSGIDWREKAKEVFRNAKKIGIGTVALFIVGNPTETPEEVKESVELAKELDPDLLQVHFFTPYPNSMCYNQFSSRIKKNDIFTMHHYASPKCNLSNIEKNALNSIQAYFYKIFFLRPKFLFYHMLKYGLFYLRNRNTFYRLLKGVKSSANSYE